MTCTKLVNFFAETPGAHLIFFDVDKYEAAAGMAAKDEVTRWEDNFPQVKSHVAMLHYAWIGRGKGPPDAQMLNGLTKALPKKTTLLDMEKELKTFIKTILKYYPESVSFITFQPTEMGNIVLSP